MVGTSGEEAEGFQLSDANGGRSMLEGGFLSLNACVEQIPLSPPLGTINPRFSPNVRRTQYLLSLNNLGSSPSNLLVSPRYCLAV